MALSPPGLAVMATGSRGRSALDLQHGAEQNEPKGRSGQSRLRPAGPTDKEGQGNVLGRWAGQRHAPQGPVNHQHGDRTAHGI